MKPKNALEKLKALLTKPSFTSKEALLCGVSSAALAYYVKQNKLIRIGHGVYRGIYAPITEDFRWEDLIEAVQRTRGGVICLISALAIYGLTEEIPRQHWIAIRNDTIHRAISTTKVVRMRNLELGKTTATIGNIVVPIFDRERTIVDAFRYLGSETALKALKTALMKKNSEKINLDKLRKYANKLRVKIEPFLMAMTI
jgi:predicted transcriptional regulator of viral defense system